MFPEATLVRFGSDLRAAAEPLDGPFCSAVGSACPATGVAAVLGTFEPAPDGRVYNTAVAFSADGSIAASYRKLHLFDAFSQRESDLVAPGSDVVLAPLACGCVGMQICYDIRFPELTRALAAGGASLVTVSAAWQAGTFKEEHWVTLLRARAIENTVWIAAVGQVPDPEREADPRADRDRPVAAHRPARRGARRPRPVGGRDRGGGGPVAGGFGAGRRCPHWRTGARTCSGRPLSLAPASRRARRQASRATWKGANDWAVAISSIVFTLTCCGMVPAQWMDSAMSSAVIGCMPA